jgi:hypothetical protein
MTYLWKIQACIQIYLPHASLAGIFNCSPGSDKLPDAFASEVHRHTKNAEGTRDSPEEAECAVIAIIGVEGDGAVAEAETDDAAHSAEDNE